MTEKIEHLKQNKNNWLFLFQQGYGLVALPLALFNFASITYYLVISNIPPLLVLFPSFQVYIVVGLVMGPILCIIIGLIYLKSPYYSESLIIAARANPYSFVLLSKEIPLYTAVYELCKKNGLNKTAEDIEKLINSNK